MALPQNLVGLYLPTTDVYDTQVIQDLNVNSDNFKEFLVRLRQSINNVSMVVNYKDSGIYNDDIFVCGQVYFPNPLLSTITNQLPDWRPVHRKVVVVPALPNAGTVTVAHGIDVNSDYTFTRIYGTATDPIGLTAVPLPYASPTAANAIELSLSATDIIITTAIDYSAYTSVFIVVEYIIG